MMRGRTYRHRPDTCSMLLTWGTMCNKVNPIILIHGSFCDFILVYRRLTQILLFVEWLSNWTFLNRKLKIYHFKLEISTQGETLLTCWMLRLVLTFRCWIFVPFIHVSVRRRIGKSVKISQAQTSSWIPRKIRKMFPASAAEAVLGQWRQTVASLDSLVVIDVFYNFHPHVLHSTNSLR